MSSGGPELIRLAPNGLVPNNALPVVLYRGCGLQSAGALIGLFRENGWGNAWRNGIYPFHHFHSTAHEVLGIATGWVEVCLGGEGGALLQLKAGDVVVLPAGTGHKRIDASADLLVVGAYPDGRNWDLMRTDEITKAGLAAARARISEVHRPATDPLFGTDGPLPRSWR